MAGPADGSLPEMQSDRQSTAPSPTEDQPLLAQSCAKLRSSRPAWLGPALGLIVLVVVASSIIGLHVRRYTTLSPIDELQHYDYLVKASSGRLVRPNERVGEAAMRAEACHGLDSPGAVVPPCDSPTLVPAQFQEYGHNTAVSQLPAYYLVSGLPARVIHKMGLIEDFFVAARLSGILWLSLGLFVTAGLLGEFGVRGVRRAVALALLAVTPVVLHASATINPDGGMLATGALVVWTVLRWERGTLPPWLVLVACVGALVLEPTNVLVVAAAALFVVMQRARADDHDARRDGLALVAGLAAVSVVVVFGADFWRDALAGDAPRPVLPRDTLFERTSIALTEYLNQLGALVTPIDGAYIPRFLAGPVLTATVALTSWLIIGAAVGVCLLGAPGRLRSLAGSVVAVMVTGGPVLAFYNYTTSGQYFSIPHRYGLSLLPALMAIVAASLRTRLSVVLVGGLAATSMIVVFGRLV